MNIFIRILNGISYAFKGIGCFGIIVIAIAVFILLQIISHNMIQRTNVGVESTIEPMYNIHIKLLQKDVDEKGNGKYFFALKSNDNVQFTAIKNKGSLIEDYSSRSHKYYFDLWNSSDKSKFTIKESINNDILSDSTS